MWHAKILDMGVRFYYCSPQARKFCVLLGFVVFFACSGLDRSPVRKLLWGCSTRTPMLRATLGLARLQNLSKSFFFKRQEGFRKGGTRPGRSRAGAQ